MLRIAAVVFTVFASAFSTHLGADASSRPGSSCPASGTVAFTGHFNVFLMNGCGRHIKAVTNRGTGYRGITYPSYDWSRDGKYMLLVRAEANQSKADVLLVSSGGKLLEALTQAPWPQDFPPTWAGDADRFLFIAATKFSKHLSAAGNRVREVDLKNRGRAAFTYTSAIGCGGGTDDPATYTYWGQTGFGGTRPTMSWAVSLRLAAYQSGCGGGVNITNLRNRTSLHFPNWNEPALSATGRLAIVAVSNGPIQSGRSKVVIVDPHNGHAIRNLGYGELPKWARDGKALYFVRRTPTLIRHGKDRLGNKVALRFFSSAVYRVNSDGSNIRRLVSEDSFGYGTLNLTPDRNFLIFSRVDNDNVIWSHRKRGVLPLIPGNFTGKYMPQVRIERLSTSGGRSVTIASNAGNPVAGP